MNLKTVRKLLTLILALTLAFALTACGGKPAETSASPSAAASPDDTASPSPVSTSEPSAEELPYFELSLSMHDPVTSSNGLFWQAWADEISAATDGHVKITLYGSSTLASAADVGAMVETGGADIGWVYTSFYKGQFPLTDVLTLPLSGFGDPVIGTNVLWDLYDKYPQLAAEWDSFKLLNLYANPGMIFCSSGKPIDSVDDLNGLVMRTPAGPITDYVTKLGASPIVMPPPDIYEAMQKNNISAYIFEPAGITNFKLQDVTKYFTDLPLYDGAFGLVMNIDKWNSLPAVYQEAIMSVSGKAGSLKAAEDFKASAEAAEKTITDAGCTWVTVSDTDLAAFQTAADEINAAWAAGLTADGFDGQAFLDEAIALAEKYGS
jgi:TRAP-type C4-dicarboxylate transport system substrate-binding protein